MERSEFWESVQHVKGFVVGREDVTESRDDASGTWNSPGFITHSCKDFCKRRTCNGFDAIPTNAIISRNSSSPASHSC